MIIQPRPINDFSVQHGPLAPTSIPDSRGDELVSSDMTAVYQEGVDAVVTAQTPEERMRLAGEFQQKEFDRLREKFIKFENAIVQRVNDYCVSFSNERENKMRFNSVYQLCERRAKAKLKITLDENGAVDNRTGDGNRKLAFSLGLPMSAINTAVPVINQYLLDSGEQPNHISAIGDDDENPDKELVVTTVVDDQHTSASFSHAISEFVRLVAIYPAAVLRQRWTETTSVVPDQDGNLVERVTFEGMVLENWPLPWVLVSNPNKQMASDQAIVIWYDEIPREVLFREEMVVDAEGPVSCDPLTGNLIADSTFVVSGRYFNLEHEKLDSDQEKPQSGQSNNRGSRFVWPDMNGREVDRDRNTATSLIGRVCVEGHVALSDLAIDGTIDQDIIQLLKINIQGVEKMTRRQLGRLLSGAFLNITVTDTGHLIEFRVCPYSPATNTMHKACLVNGDGFYGQGIVQLGNDLDEIIEQHINSNMQICMRRADPNYAVNDRPMMDNLGNVLTYADISRLMTGLGQVLFTNSDVDKAIKTIFPEANDEWIQELSILITQYQERTFINEAVKGTHTGETATENRNNLGQGLTRVIERAKQIGVDVIEPIDRRLLQHVEYFMGDPAQFESYVIKLAGAKGLKANYMFPSVKGLADQFKITHSGQSSQNAEVQEAQFHQICTFFIPVGNMDPDAALIERLNMNGRKNPDRFLSKGVTVKDPRQEIKAFAQNRYLAPSPMENAMQHYTVHLAQLASLDSSQIMQLDPMIVQAAAAQGVMVSPKPPGLENFRFDVPTIIPQLIQHMKETEQLIQAMFAAAQQAAMQAQAANTGGTNGQNAQNPSGQPKQQTSASLNGGVKNSVAKPPLAGMMQ